jgi:hypothetical protein
MPSISISSPHQYNLLDLGAVFRFLVRQGRTQTYTSIING